MSTCLQFQEEVKFENLFKISHSLLEECLEEHRSDTPHYYLNEDDLERLWQNTFKVLHVECLRILKMGTTISDSSEKPRMKEELIKSAEDEIDKTLNELKAITKKVIINGDATFEAW